MPILLGENINLGVGVEATRGTQVDPQAFIPARTPTGIMPVVEKVLMKETRKSRANSYDSEIIQVRAEGDLEFNIRSKTIGYILKSLIGSPVSVSGSGAYNHTFQPDIDNIQQPSLSLYLAQEGQQHYAYPNAVVKSLEISTPVNDVVNAKASFVATKENAVAEINEATVVWDDNDKIFRPYNVSIKVANNVAGLAGASNLPVKEFKLNINNNARPDVNLGNINPADVYGLLFEITGNMKLDHTDEVWHDYYTNGNKFALRITLSRPDVTIGSTVPSLVFTLPKCSVENWSPDRPIDDVAKDGIDFTAHYDETDGQITAVLTNQVADYLPAGS
jgi:hypothetical protein